MRRDRRARPWQGPGEGIGWRELSGIWAWRGGRRVTGSSFALIVAAGRGHRAGAPLPKQYLRLRGRAVLHHSIAAFARLPEVEGIRVVIQPADRRFYDEALEGLPAAFSRKLLEPVAGGARRQDSVRNGLESLVETAPDVVMIHDAARPLADAALIRRTLGALARAEGALAALPVSDTLKRASGTEGDYRSAGTVDRTGLWRAQTPQSFRFARILEAHRRATGRAFTDDAAVAEAAGLSVALVEGSEENLKVTTVEDLARAEAFLAERLSDLRVGWGFDVHRFGAGERVMLCGIAVPHAAALTGHSDADVGLHALVDALLGALGQGDIGTHFPADDPQWRGADSASFARRALELVREAGGVIAHIDITLFCERPRIGPHREAMIARVAEILELAPGRVSVKATTTDGLGFLGRAEGIAAQATATLRLPVEAPNP